LSTQHIAWSRSAKKRLVVRQFNPRHQKFHIFLAFQAAGVGVGLKCTQLCYWPGALRLNRRGNVFSKKK
jgi:hypothetical protein